MKAAAVSKTIRGTPIVNDIDLEVRAGEAVALCGGNGAGKSTMLRMIVGIAEPSRGTINTNGISSKADRKRYAEQIGYMPDDYIFANGLSARETLSFWAAMRGLPKAVVQQALEKVGLADVQAKPVKSFSKGMRQRLLFAQAIMAKPPLLVMDEPTNGLDPYWMESFVKLVRSLKEEGCAVLFSTHQLHVAEAVADRILFMDNGELIEEGTVDDYKRKYGPLGVHAVFSGLLR